MSQEKNYPLLQLLTIKKRRLEEAEKVLQEKKALLSKEEEKLRSLETLRNEVKGHYQAKLSQLRETLDAGTTSDKIQQMKEYLKIVAEKLKVEEQKVADQSKVVSQAKEQVDIAKKDFLKKQKDIEKLDLHHSEWKEEHRLFLNRKEGVEADEMGSALHRFKRSEHSRKKRQ